MGHLEDGSSESMQYGVSVGKGWVNLVYLSPFVAAGVATVELRLPGTLFPRG
jgi:hypothetical protein